MKCKKLITKLALAAGAMGLTLASFAGDDFAIVGLHIDSVNGPKDFFQASEECSESKFCSSIIEGVSEYFGIPLDEVMTGAAAFAGEQDGEGTFMHLGLPGGYVYCKSSMTMTSIVPHDGPRGSTFLGRADEKSIYLETWTPVQPWTGGRSWVEADVSLVGVIYHRAEEAYSSGECIRPESRNLFFCRGGGCVDTADEGQSVSSASAPGANSRN